MCHARARKNATNQFLLSVRAGDDGGNGSHAWQTHSRTHARPRDPACVHAHTHTHGKLIHCARAFKQTMRGVPFCGCCCCSSSLGHAFGFLLDCAMCPHSLCSLGRSRQMRACIHAHAWFYCAIITSIMVLTQPHSGCARPRTTNCGRYPTCARMNARAVRVCVGFTVCVS